MTNASNDFAALARQYLDLWNGALGGLGQPPSAAAGVTGLQDMLEAWSRHAGGQDAFGPALEHFNRQSCDWFAQMQQVAARFSGHEHSAGDVADAWRNAFAGSHPFAALMDGMRGPGLESLAQWAEAGAPSLQGLRSEVAAKLRMPAFGFTREHQQRLQALALAQLRSQEAQQAYAALLARASQDAYARFEKKLREHEAPGRQIESVRALFDVWVDAAEDAWAEMALSPEYRQAFGELVNAQMRQRAAAQAIGEQAAAGFGMPTRAELDGAHRRLADLERQLWRLRQHEEAPAPPAAAKRPTARPAKATVKPVIAKATVKPAVAKATAAKPGATKNAATKKAPAKKSPAKKAPAKKAGLKKTVAKPAARRR